MRYADTHKQETHDRLVSLAGRALRERGPDQLAVAELMGSHRKVRGWSALVTQNILHDRTLIRTLARLNCMVLFAGIESLDVAMPIPKSMMFLPLCRRDPPGHCEERGFASLD